MRLTKMFGLAVVAAIAAMAFIGASSASAGAISCKLGTGAAGPCPAGYESFVAGITGLGLGEDTFTSGFVTVKCTGEMTGTITAQGSATTNAKGKIETVKWTNCKNNIGCATTAAAAENLNWAVEALMVGTELFLDVENVLGSFTLTSCPIVGNVKCFYTSTKVTPKFENHSGAGNSMITATNLALTREAGSSGSCSANGTWSALYDIDPAGVSILLA